MKGIYYYIILVFFLLLSFIAQSQVITDSVIVQTTENKSIIKENLKKLKNDKVKFDTVSKVNAKPDPIKTLWMGVIIPGYGQIMNKKYWKLPIVYGGFLGCAYAITWNSTRYNAYRNGYRDIIDTDNTTNAHLEILPTGYTVDSYGGISAYTNVLKSGMESYRYNRDLMVLATIAYFGITLVDAFVDAQLSDFDISNELSMKIKPVLIHPTYGMSNSYGLQCSLSLK